MKLGQPIDSNKPLSIKLIASYGGALQKPKDSQLTFARIAGVIDRYKVRLTDAGPLIRFEGLFEAILGPDSSQLPLELVEEPPLKRLTSETAIFQRGIERMLVSKLDAAKKASSKTRIEFAVVVKLLSNNSALGYTIGHSWIQHPQQQVIDPLAVMRKALLDSMTEKRDESAEHLPASQTDGQDGV